MIFLAPDEVPSERVPANTENQKSLRGFLAFKAFNRRTRADTGLGGIIICQDLIISIMLKSAVLKGSYIGRFQIRIKRNAILGQVLPW